MTEFEKDYMLRDDLERVSLQLGSLQNMIKTIHNGLLGERIETQAVDCIDCIGFCVEGIKDMVDSCLVQISEKAESQDV